MGVYKNKKLCATKEMVSKLRPPNRMGENLASCTSDKELIARIYTAAHFEAMFQEDCPPSK
jgi:hypothetical protein